MPNHTVNSFCIKCEKDKINKILKECFTGNEFDFNTLIPEPATKEDCPKEYVCKDNHSDYEEKIWFDWYKWRCDNWGTKWNAYDTSYYINGNKLSLEFLTAWSPSLPIFKALVNKYDLKENQIEFCYANEDVSDGFGKYSVSIDKNGNKKFVEYEFKSAKEGACFWCEMWGGEENSLYTIDEIVDFLNENSYNLKQKNKNVKTKDNFER